MQSNIIEYTLIRYLPRFSFYFIIDRNNNFALSILSKKLSVLESPKKIFYSIPNISIIEGRCGSSGTVSTAYRYIERATARDYHRIFIIFTRWGVCGSDSGPKGSAGWCCALSGPAEWHSIKVAKMEPPAPLLAEVPEIVRGQEARCPRYVRRITCVTRISGHRYFPSVKYRGHSTETHAKRDETFLGKPWITEYFFYTALWVFF